MISSQQIVKCLLDSVSKVFRNIQNILNKIKVFGFIFFMNLLSKKLMSNLFFIQLVFYDVEQSWMKERWWHQLVWKQGFLCKIATLWCLTKKALLKDVYWNEFWDSCETSNLYFRYLLWDKRESHDLGLNWRILSYNSYQKFCL